MSSSGDGYNIPKPSSAGRPSDEEAHERNDYGSPAVSLAENDTSNSFRVSDATIGVAHPATFKRKPTRRPNFNLSNLSTLLPSSVNNLYARLYPPPDSPHGGARELLEASPQNNSRIGLGHPGNSNNSTWSGSKENGRLDWHMEGPGRRIGYEDSTTIDWIFEYTKERQRVRILNGSASGILGYSKRLLDASHVWFVLVTTGILVGVIAASIDTVAIWLGDIKSGFCKHSAEGGRFYLRREFCCWGHDDPSQCQDWKTWRQALHVPSRGGAYTVEYIFSILYSGLFAATSAFLVKRYAPFARHSGIPELKTILGGFVIRRFLGAWTLIIKSLGLCLAVASGMWVGKEGPYVHIACCCANLVMQPIDVLRNNEARKREIFSAAAASAISVAFGAPIGGVLFSLEQLSYYFPDKTMWQSFVCAMVAAVTLQAINPFRTGKIVLYQIEYSSSWHGFEMVPFAVLGIIGGIYGGLFIRLNMLFAKFRKSTANPLRSHPILEVLIVSILTAVINYPNVMMRGQRSELVHSLFSECSTSNTNDSFGLCTMTTVGTISMVSLLLTASGLGSLLATISFGLQIPAGIILPSLAIGALYGRALGVVVQLFQKHHATSLLFSSCEADIPCITPGTYAIVGAASALTGVTRMTVSIVVIMFELTGALTYVLPIMIAVMLSKWIGDIFSRQGIYESWITFNEYPYLDNRDDTPAPDVTASNVMTPVGEMVCIDAREDHSIQSLSTLLSTTNFRGFPVVFGPSPVPHQTHTSMDPPSSLDAPETRSVASDIPGGNTLQNTLLGYISRTELSFALSTVMSPQVPASRNPLAGRNLPPHTPCFFSHVPAATASTLDTLDLRPWMDQTPMTLNAESSLQLALNMFQRLGLRYLLFVERGALRGLLTKKDMWLVLGSSRKVLGEESHYAPDFRQHEDGLDDDAAGIDPSDLREDERRLLADTRAGRTGGTRPRSNTEDTLDL